MSPQPVVLLIPALAGCPCSRRVTDQAGMESAPGFMLDVAAPAASPEAFFWSRHADAWASLSDVRMLHTHTLVERWSLDEMPLPRRLFDEIVELLYRRDLFLRRTLRVGDRIADPRRVTAPILSVVQRQSSIVPPEAVLPFHSAARSANKTVLWYERDRGVALQHVGALVGRSAHQHLWPQIIQWVIRSRLRRFRNRGGDPAQRPRDGPLSGAASPRVADPAKA